MKDETKIEIANAILDATRKGYVVSLGYVAKRGHWIVAVSHSENSSKTFTTSVVETEKVPSVIAASIEAMENPPPAPEKPRERKKIPTKAEFLAAEKAKAEVSKNTTDGKEDRAGTAPRG